MSLTNDTTMIAKDVQEIYEFEKQISIVRIYFFEIFIFIFFFKFHWTAAEQRARQNETIRTTIGNLTQIFNTSVNSFLIYLIKISLFLSFFGGKFSSILQIIFVKFIN
jgi:hypothetical protein